MPPAAAKLSEQTNKNNRRMAVIKPIKCGYLFDNVFAFFIPDIVHYTFYVNTLFACSVPPIGKAKRQTSVPQGCITGAMGKEYAGEGRQTGHINEECWISEMARPGSGGNRPQAV